MARLNAPKIPCILLLFAVLTFAVPAQTERNSAFKNRLPSSGFSDLVYVSLDTEQSIAVYRIDSVQGSLSFIKKITVGGEPGSLTVDPTHTFLYAAIRSTNSISSFRINTRDGDLTLINTIRAAGNPVYVGTDKTGKFLLTAYFGESRAAIYFLRQDGGVRDSAIQVLETEKNAHAIQIDPTNRFLFIPCRTGETIHQFRFDAINGILTPNTPDRILTPAKTGPRHLAFHPSLNIAYFANEFGSTVTAYHTNPDGILSELQTLTSLPKDSVGPNTGADVHVTPDGRFLYASNRGHESIAAFSIDEGTGRLAPIGYYPTEKTPRSFSLDPGGRFLYAGGQGSGRVAAYSVNQRSGELTPLKRYDVGRNPVWILTVRIPDEQ